MVCSTTNVRMAKTSSLTWCSTSIPRLPPALMRWQTLSTTARWRTLSPPSWPASRCSLLETLADRIATACLVDARVARAEVSVHKPHAPIDLAFDDVVVTIVRSRGRPEHDERSRCVGIESRRSRGPLCKTPSTRSPTPAPLPSRRYLRPRPLAAPRSPTTTTPSCCSTHSCHQPNCSHWRTGSKMPPYANGRNDGAREHSTSTSCRTARFEATTPTSRCRIRARTNGPLSWCRGSMLTRRAQLVGHGAVRDLLATLDMSGVHRLAQPMLRLAERSGT